MKEHAERNNIWDRSQLRTCSGVLETVDQLIIDNFIMDEVRNQQRNLSVVFCDHQKVWHGKTKLDDKNVPVDGSTRESS